MKYKRIKNLSQRNKVLYLQKKQGQLSKTEKTTSKPFQNNLK